jgi:hypothetical protein
MIFVLSTTKLPEKNDQSEKRTSKKFLGPKILKKIPVKYQLESECSDFLNDRNACVHRKELGKNNNPAYFREFFIKKTRKQ